MWVRLVGGECECVYKPHVPGSAGSENWVQVALSCIINRCTRWMMFCHRYAAGSRKSRIRHSQRHQLHQQHQKQNPSRRRFWMENDGGICQLQKQVKIFIKVKIVAQLVGGGGRWERWGRWGSWVWDFRSRTRIRFRFGCLLVNIHTPKHTPSHHLSWHCN